MYYYIMEQPRSLAERNLQRKIKDMVGMLGLAGEIVTASPARSAEEAVEIALNKGYNTVIAVGSDKLVNRVASLLQGKEVVLGIIPIKTGPIINKIIGLESIEEACQALKKRFLKIVDLAYLYPHHYFLTAATISAPRPVEMEMEIDQFKTITKVTDLMVVSPAINTLQNQYSDFEQSDNRLNIYLTNKEEQAGKISKFLHWLWGKKCPNKVSSLFRARKFIINTSSPLPVVIDNQVVDKTPVIFITKPRALKIITSRGKIEGKIKISGQGG